MAVPYTFGSATSAIPLSQLDSNFATTITLGNTAIQLGNTVTTLNNMTLANVTISSGNVTITNVSVTTANVTTLNAATVIATAGNITTVNATTVVATTANATTANITTGNLTDLNLTNNPTFSGGTANGVLYLNGSKVATSGSALTFDGSSLGVGIATPTFADGKGIHINNAVGSARLHLTSQTSGSASTDGSEFTVAGSDLYIINNESAATIFYNAGSEQMRLTSTGLGIGTSSPNNKLTVEDSTAYNGITVRGNAAPTIRFFNGTSTWKTGISGNNGANFSISKDGGADDKLTLDSSGNLGLGVTPVNSAGYIKMQINGTTGGILDLLTNGTRTLTAYSGSSSSTFGTVTNTPLIFQTNDSSKMTLDASGNLGLGVTPSADWASSSYKAFVVRTSFLAGSTAPGTMVLGNNAYNDGAGWKYVATGVASYYVQNAGAHLWSYAASGTAGNAITFTQAMTLDASGQLQIGVTSAYGTSMLSVNGDVCIPNGYGYSWGSNSSSFTGVVGSNSTNYVATYTGGTERARIDSSGNLLVGTTTQRGNITSEASASIYGCIGTNATVGSGTRYHAVFYDSGTEHGSITSDGTNVAFNTSSDYRLKNITGPVSNSGAYIDSLKPVEGTWKEDGSTFVGLIAHEAQEVSRTTVATGEKDGERMQSMDYGNAEFIANIIAELQSLRKRVAQLEKGN